MKKDRKITILNIVFILLVTVGGRLLFILPDKKYLNILNGDDFFVLCSVVLIVCLLVGIVLFKKVSKMKKLMTAYVLAFIIFAGVGTYFYTNLPHYTYEQAVAEVEAYAAETFGAPVQAEVPPARVDKIGFDQRSFLQMTNAYYYVYLKVEQEDKVYRFDPYTGLFEPSDRQLEWLE
ncbi:hypothetical protein G4V62_08925 [Bacillaceae bacterium SIJ1]|uniref:hypothetical protein n=1 Tax=Litoribacterium kuwaitense TaxID=1398745 RepID=UPI0013EE27AB|nr:hypothetical protein [Litoribacterium kuwaitense]NGP45074.1 hypothetical protein [Litoribacterium kuwaitense]